MGISNISYYTNRNNVLAVIKTPFHIAGTGWYYINLIGTFDVLNHILKSLKSVSSVFQTCFKSVSRVFQSVSNVLQNCFIDRHEGCKNSELAIKLLPVNSGDNASYRWWGY